MKWLLVCVLVVNVMCSTDPNIIITIGSGLGIGDIGAKNVLFNTENTRNIDKLASEGINYFDFHVGAGTDGPSMAALLTGRYGQRNGVNKIFKPDSVGGLPLSELTLANFLHNSGYITGYIGVWDLGHQASYLPLARGFDYFYGTPYNPLLGCIHAERTFVFGGVNLTCDVGKVGVPLMENNTIIQQPLWADNISVATFHKKTERFVEDAVAQNKPFFLIVSPVEINLPVIAPPSPYPTKSFLLKAFDYLVASSQELLSRHNIADNTISMVTSKTGPIGANCDLSGDVGPFIGLWQVIKDEQSSPTMGSNWEGALRVPFIFNWPQRIKRGAVDTNLRSSVDILPTISQIVAFSLPADRVFDGVSMVDDWSGKKDTIPRTLYFLESGTDEVFAFRRDYFKVYFRTNGAKRCSSMSDPSQSYIYHPYPLVFDLNRDESEFRNSTYDEYHAALFLEAKKIGDEMFKNESYLKSTANYSQDKSAVLCCNAQCRCSTAAPAKFLSGLALFLENKASSFGNINIKIMDADHQIVPIYGLVFICLGVTVFIVFVAYKTYDAFVNSKLMLYQPFHVISEDEIERLISTDT